MRKTGQSAAWAVCFSVWTAWAGAEEAAREPAASAKPPVVSAAAITTVVTSESMSYDYEKGEAVFSKDVFVNDPRMRLWSDRLTLVFEGTNQVRTLVAEGRVRFAQADGRGSCRKAEYQAAEGQVVLTGEAVLIRGSDEIRADTIAFLFADNVVRNVKATGNVQMRRVSDGSAKGLPALLPGMKRAPSP